MTASFRLDARVDLHRMLSDNPLWCKRNRGFDAVSLRLFTRCAGPLTALVYASGAVVLVGGRSLPQLEEAVHIMMEKTGASIRTALVAHNMACSFSVSALRLDRAAVAIGHDKQFCDVSLEPELFPALTFTLRGTNRKACVFASGKINLVGNKSISEAEEMKGRVTSCLRSFIR